MRQKLKKRRKKFREIIYDDFCVFFCFERFLREGGRRAHIIYSMHIWNTMAGYCICTACLCQVTQPNCKLTTAEAPAAMNGSGGGRWFASQTKVKVSCLINKRYDEMLIKMNERELAHMCDVSVRDCEIYRKREKLPNGSAANAVVCMWQPTSQRQTEKNWRGNLCLRKKQNKRLTIAHVLFIIEQILCNSKGWNSHFWAFDIAKPIGHIFILYLLDIEIHRIEHTHALAHTHTDGKIKQSKFQWRFEPWAAYSAFVSM